MFSAFLLFMECDRSRTIDTGDSKDSAGYEDLAWRSGSFLYRKRSSGKISNDRRYHARRGEETFAELVAYYEGRGAYLN